MKTLKDWFQNIRRPLPWREDPTPYRVWISEVMLQQTQASVVIPYFEKWMEHFPTIHDLANAHLDEVIKVWEGLGYYSRARNLHAGAQFLCEKHAGKLPEALEELKAIKGLGDYTAGAILNFAFRKRAPAIDGNVQRVISRYANITSDITKKEGKLRVEEQVCTLLENDVEPWVVSEALIELGALVCKKRANCTECPLQKSCRATKLGTQDELPVKPERAKTIPLYRSPILFASEKGLLLKKTPHGEVMQDLFEFPYFDTTPKGPSEKKIKSMLTSWNISSISVIPLPPVKHGFTRYRVHLFPHLAKVKDAQIEGYRWYSIEEVKKLPFSSGHRRVLADFRKL